MQAAWRRFLDRIVRFFKRAPPEPGHWSQGRRASMRGLLRVAPWVWPTRDYQLYTPAMRRMERRRARPLLVLLHGCKQTPEEFAAGTRIAALADAHGWLVLMPRQSEKANAWRCWNWFDRATLEGHGEAAIVAAQVKAVRRFARVRKDAVFVAGLSAGGALAAILGVRHPNLFAGVFVQAGLPCGSAASVHSAANAMKRGPEVDVAAIGAAARKRSGGKRVALVVVHGEADEVVAMANAKGLVRQYLALNGRESRADDDGLPKPDDESREPLGDGRAMRVAEWRDAQGTLVRLVRIPGLGHAWPGGDADYAFNDARPPSSSALLAQAVMAWRQGAA